MDPRPFPKPVPAEPLDETVWLRQTDRAEVGRESFFSGRDAEYEVFQNAAGDLRDGRIGGGTMIFQGAPGVGKSALMQECMEAVRQHSTPQEPWVAAAVESSDLRSPRSVMSALIDAADAETRRLSALGSDVSKMKHLMNFGKRLYDELSQRGFSLAGVSIGGESQIEHNTEISPAELFRNAAALLEDFRFVVFVDEAQNTPASEMTKAIVNCLHRASNGIHLAAVFFGLSDTEEVLGECGLSRLGRGRVVNLEPLSLVDAAGSFKRMLDTYYTGSEQEKNTWSAALAELSQGWPQHIIGIGTASGQLIHSGGGQLKSSLLETALEKGTEAKNDYYDHRLKAGYINTKLYVQLAVEAGRKSNGLLDIDELQDLAETELLRTGTSFDAFLRKSLHAGLLAPAKGPLRRYKFPIPSLRDYLRSHAEI